MSSLSRKQRRALLKKNIGQKAILSEEEYNQLYEAIKKDVCQQVTYKTLAVAIGILDKSYGKLKPRETRFEVFLEEYKHELELLETPTLLQNEYEERLKKVGLEIKW